MKRRRCRRSGAAIALATATAAVGCAAIVTTPGRALAATKQWTSSSSGNWSTAASWTSSTVPATGDTVNIADNAAGVKTVTFDGSVAVTSLGAMTVGGTSNSFTGAMTLAFPVGSTKILTVTGATSVGGTSTGANAQGTIKQDGATFTATGGLTVGATAMGFYTLTAGTLTAPTENIAQTATGFATFTQSGGVHNSTTLTMASDPAANAVYNLSGGTLAAATETIGNTGSATVNQTGGTHTNTVTLLVGQSSGTNAFYNLSVGSLTSPNQTWGNAGNATMTHSSGTNTISGAAATDSLLIGSQAFSLGLYTLSGGTLNVTAAGGAVIGKAGNGTLVQSGGTFTIAAGKDLSIGTAAGGLGAYSQAFGTSLSAGGNVYIGGTSAAAGGNGSMSIGGTATVTGTVKVWNVSGNSLSISQGATLTAASIDTGGNANNLVWNGGNLNITGAGGTTIGTTGNLPNAIALQPGQNLTVTANTTVQAGSGFSIGGGSFSTASLSAPASSVAYTAGNFTLTTGGLAVDATGPLGANVTLPTGSNMSIAGAMSVGGTLTFAGGAVINSSTLTNTGVITGFGSINGTGTTTNSGLMSVFGGALTISKTGTVLNSATGKITIDSGRQLTLNGGTLTNSGTIDLDGSGTITSNNGQTLVNASDGLITGVGTISLLLQNSGTMVVPAGTLNVTNAFANGGIIRMGDIGSRLTVSGAGVTNNAGSSLTGIGRINSTLSNSGYVEAIGGVLQFAGTTTNNTGGTLASGSGTQLLITGTPGANAGSISLTGGTLHTNSQPFTNAALGVISGYGTIRTGGAGLTNNGQILLSGGSTSVYGAVSGTAGSKVIVSGGATATFYDPVSMALGSEFRVSTASTAVFFAPVTGQANFTGLGTKDFESGPNSIMAGLSTGGATIVQSGATLTTSDIRENSLTANGDVTIVPDGTSAGTSRVSALAIAQGTKVDISNNKLIVAGAGNTGSWNGSGYTGTTGLIVSGRNGGGWNGWGILTTQSSAQGGTFTTLGVATAGEVGRSGSNFGGINVSASDVLVMYTYGGDANLDGKINIDDYVRIDSGIAGGATGWVNGDFNYDGKVNIDDYSTVIDANIGNQGAAFPLGSEATSDLSGVSAVPEPAMTSMLFIPALLAMRRRSRRSPVR